MAVGELIGGPPSRIATSQQAQLVVNVTIQKSGRPLFRRTGDVMVTGFLFFGKWAASSPATMPDSFFVSSGRPGTSAGG
jgi:hypothetical protein